MEGSSARATLLCISAWFYRCPPCLQIECFVKLRHLDTRAAELCGELLHGAFLAVDEKGARGLRGLVPGQQRRLIGVGGKTPNGIDARPHRNVFVENSDMPRAVDDAARRRAVRSVADKNGAALRAPEIVLEVMADA